jgi:hypothetical protein
MTEVFDNSRVQIVSHSGQVSHRTPEKSENARKRGNGTWSILGLVQDKMVETGRNRLKMEENASALRFTQVWQANLRVIFEICRKTDWVQWKKKEKKKNPMEDEDEEVLHPSVQPTGHD